MSSLALYFKSIGKNVAGYDKTVTPLTSQLEKEGIAIHYDDSIELTPIPSRSRIAMDFPFI